MTRSFHYFLLPGLLFFFTARAQIQQQPTWYWQQPLPQGNTILDVARTSGSSAVAVGFCGTVLRTNDAGKSWDALFLADTLHLLGVAFGDADHGIAIGLEGMMGVLLRTVDGGESWQKVHSQYATVFQGVDFASPDVAMVVGPAGAMLRSVDGGVTWESMTPVTEKTLYAVNFASGTTGWIVGYEGTLLRTDDAGVHWTPVNASPVRRLYNVCFHDDLTGVIVGSDADFDGCVLFSSDGGNTWNPSSGFTRKPKRLISAVWADDGSCIVSEKQGVAYRSSDFGASWDSLSTVIDANAFTTFGDGIICSAGWDGRITRSTDAGSTWEATTTALYVGGLHGVFFLDSAQGWSVGGFSSAGTPCVVLRTTDAGSHWQRFDAEANGVTLHDVQFLTPNTGWAVGGYTGGSVIKSSDGGENWDLQNVPTLYHPLRCVFFLDEQTGWAASGKSVISTSNGGTDWIECGNTEGSINAVYFLDSNEGWAVGTGLYHTTDAGVTWTTIIGLTTEYLYDIRFHGHQRGVAVGDGCTVLTTTDGGATWNAATHGPSGTYLRSVTFADADHVWAVGETGIVLRSTDGGVSWIRASAGCMQDLNAVCSVAPDRLWAVGAHGSIISTVKPGDIPTVIAGHGNSLPDIIELRQNYPNPCGDVTVVEYLLRQGGRMELSMLDANGSQVQRISRDHPVPGTYTQQLALDGLASGVYFLRLRSAGQQLLRRLIVLRR